MIPQRPFIFLRHGQTDWNLERRAQGSTDIPLNDAGRAQARAAAAGLRSAGARRVVSSPLGRARETAEIVGAALGLPVALSADLSEVNFGVLEGRSWGADFDAFYAGTLHPEGGESFEAFCLRVRRGLAAALEEGGPALIVAHGGVWKAMRFILRVSPWFAAPNCAPFRVWPAPEGWRAETPAQEES